MLVSKTLLFSSIEKQFPNLNSDTKTLKTLVVPKFDSTQLRKNNILNTQSGLLNTFANAPIPARPMLNTQFTET